MLQTIELARLAPPPAVPRIRGRRARRPQRSRERHRPGRPVRHRRARRSLLLRQRAPAPPHRAAGVPHRPHADHQRDVPELRRGRRLRAPAVVAARRGRGRRSTTSRTPRAGAWAHGRVAPLDAGRLGAAGPGRARGAHLLVRGRRLRKSTRRAPPHRGGVGEGGDLGPGVRLGPCVSVGRRGTRAAPCQPRPRRARPGARRRLSGRGRALRRARDARRRLGVDGERVRWLRRLRRPSLPRVLRGVLRPRLPGAARRLMGHAGAGPTPTFRNWDLPQRRQIFSGVRLAWDA